MHMYLDILNVVLAEISKCGVDVYKAEAAQLTEPTKIGPSLSLERA
jgi:hypothetical protein